MSRPQSSCSHLERSSAETSLKNLVNRVCTHDKYGPNDILKALKVVEERRQGKLYPEDFAKIWGYFGLHLNERKIANLFAYFDARRPGASRVRPLRRRQHIHTSELRHAIFPDEPAPVEDAAVSVAGSQVAMPRIDMSAVTGGCAGESSGLSKSDAKHRAALEVVANNPKLQNLELKLTTSISEILGCFELSTELAGAIRLRITATGLTTFADLRRRVDRQRSWAPLSLPPLLEKNLRRLAHLVARRDEKPIDSVLAGVVKTLGGRLIAELPAVTSTFLANGITTLEGLDTAIAGKDIWERMNVPDELRAGLEIELERPLVDPETLKAVMVDMAKEQRVAPEPEFARSLSTSRSKARVDAMGLFGRQAVPRARTAVPGSTRKVEVKPFGKGKAVYTPLYKRKTKPLRRIPFDRRHMSRLPSVKELDPREQVEVLITRPETPSNITEWLY